MKNVEIRRLEMFLHVDRFGETHAGSFPAGSLGAELFAILREIIAAVRNEAVKQSSGAVAVLQATAERERARAALRQTLKIIIRTAHAFDGAAAEFKEKFQMPRDRSDQALLTTARVVAGELATLKSHFMRFEMPETILEDLHAGIDALRRTITSQDAGRSRRVGSTVNIGAEIERGFALVRRLDVVVRNVFRDDRPTLAEWESVSHVERRLRHRKSPRADQPPDAAHPAPHPETPPA